MKNSILYIFILLILIFVSNLIFFYESFDNNDENNNDEKTIIFCYSNSDYYDVLNVQNDYLKKIKNIYKILIIDKIIPEHNNLEFDKIIFYDNNISYTKRINNSLKIIKENNDIKNKDYLIFIHETDVVIKYDDSIIKLLINEMKKNNIDRIQLSPVFENENPTFDPYDNLDIGSNKINFKLYKNKFMCYTVTPGIWNVNIYIYFTDNFDNDYRKAENNDTMNFCNKNMNVYYLYSLNEKDTVRTTQNYCINFFVTLRLTSNSKKLNINITPNNDDEILVLNEYNYIMSNYQINEKRKY